VQVEGKESGVLGVVIGPEGIMMEREKVKRILEWLTLTYRSSWDWQIITANSFRASLL